MCFAPDTTARRDLLTMRDKALRAIALRQASLYLSTQTLDEVISTNRGDLATELQSRIQTAFDDQRTGVEVVPIVVDGTRDALPKHGLIFRRWKPATFRVHVLNPLAPDSQANVDALNKELHCIMQRELTKMRGNCQERETPIISKGHQQ